MSQQTPSPQQPPSLPLVHRAAVPVALFAVAFLAFLTLSERFALPALLTMRLPDAVLTPADVLPKKQRLAADIAALEARRDEQMTHGDVLHTYVRSAAAEAAELERLFDSALRVTREQSTDGVTVSLSRVALHAQARTLRLEGELVGSAPGTMTALAAYVDRLNDLEQVTSVDASPFTRVVRDDGTFVSPFSLVLHAR